MIYQSISSRLYAGQWLDNLPAQSKRVGADNTVTAWVSPSGVGRAWAVVVSDGRQSRFFVLWSDPGASRSRAEGAAREYLRRRAEKRAAVQLGLWAEEVAA